MLQLQSSSRSIIYVSLSVAERFWFWKCSTVGELEQYYGCRWPGWLLHFTPICERNECKRLCLTTFLSCTGHRGTCLCRWLLSLDIPVAPWTSYQIRKIAGCACAGNAGSVFPANALKGNRGLAIPACIMARAGPHVPWCMSGSLTCGGGENVPGIPGACAARNFTYLVRGPLSPWSWPEERVAISGKMCFRWISEVGI